MIGIERTQPGPRVLHESSAKDRHRHPDVVNQLAKDFHRKCYICEVKPVEDPEVEHRLPHKGGRFEDRVYDWDNLFYACGHCNTVKNKAKYDAGIIDCCTSDPEGRLVQVLAENDVRIRAVDPRDAQARLTAELLEEVFMTNSSALRNLASAAKLEKLQLRMNALYEKLGAYAAGDRDSFTMASIASMLSRDEAFAGFTRCYVKQRLDSYPDLETFLQP